MQTLTKAVGVVAITVAVSGCAGLTNVINTGAETSDNALGASEFVLCRGATVGSVLRRYGTSTERMKAWRAICADPAADIFYGAVTDDESDRPE